MSRLNASANVSLVVANVRACAKVAVITLRRLHLHFIRYWKRFDTDGLVYGPEMMSNPWSGTQRYMRPALPGPDERHIPSVP